MFTYKIYQFYKLITLQTDSMVYNISIIYKHQFFLGG